MLEKASPEINSEAEKKSSGRRAEHLRKKMIHPVQLVRQNLATGNQTRPAARQQVKTRQCSSKKGNHWKYYFLPFSL
jgi:hypothetical protein